MRKDQLFVKQIHNFISYYRFVCFCCAMMIYSWKFLPYCWWSIWLSQQTRLTRKKLFTIQPQVHFLFTFLCYLQYDVLVPIFLFVNMPQIAAAHSCWITGTVSQALPEGSLVVEYPDMGHSWSLRYDFNAEFENAVLFFWHKLDFKKCKGA